jgi:hypothetical protein
MFRLLHHFLRILLLSALFSLQAFLLNHSKRLCHVFDLIPNIKAYVDRASWAVAKTMQSLGRASISMTLFCCNSFSALRTSLA